MHTDTEQYRSIQALRAIAAFMVVMAHAAKDFHTLKVPGHEFITQFQRGGLFGVDLFFCISGFIIFLTTHNRAGNLNASLKSFAHKRFLRIYPSYWMASLIFISLYAIGLVQNFEKPLSPGYFFKSMLLLPQSTSPILGPGWTLVHEVKFYLMYIFIVTVWYRNYLLGLALWGLLSFAVFSASLFKVGFLDNHIVGRAANYFFHPMSLEFIGGVFLAKYRHQISGWISSKWMLVLISLLALAVISGLSDLKYGKGPGVVKYYSVLLYFPVALLLLAACVSLEQIGKLKVRQFWVKLGDASYSTYLIHRPMLKVVVPVFAALGISTIFASAVAFVAVCLVVQLAAYYYFVRFDNKLYEYLRKKL